MSIKRTRMIILLQHETCLCEGDMLHRGAVRCDLLWHGSHDKDLQQSKRVSLAYLGAACRAGSMSYVGAGHECRRVSTSFSISRPRVLVTFNTARGPILGRALDGDARAPDWRTVSHPRFSGKQPPRLLPSGVDSMTHFTGYIEGAR